MRSLCITKGAPDGVRGTSVELRNDPTVESCRDRDRGMPEVVRDDLERDTVRQGERGPAVPEAVKRDSSHAGRRQQRMPRMADLARCQRPTDSVGEDEAFSVLPVGSYGSPGGVLSLRLRF